MDQARGGATIAERDALTLLAVMMQHTDSKPEQQELLCLPGGVNDDGMCKKPFLMLHDIGLTFGHGNHWNRNSQGSVNFAEWSRTPMWRDRSACVAYMSKSQTGTLGNPYISEAGRAFLADLLQQLTDTQLRDLFEVGRAIDVTSIRRHRPPAWTTGWPRSSRSGTRSWRIAVRPRAISPLRLRTPCRPLPAATAEPRTPPTSLGCPSNRPARKGSS